MSREIFFKLARVQGAPADKPEIIANFSEGFYGHVLRDYLSEKGYEDGVHEICGAGMKHLEGENEDHIQYRWFKVSQLDTFIEELDAQIENLEHEMHRFNHLIDRVVLNIQDPEKFEDCLNVLESRIEDRFDKEIINEKIQIIESLEELKTICKYEARKNGIEFESDINYLDVAFYIN